MRVEPNWKWTSLYHITLRYLVLGIYPLLLFIFFLVSLLNGATGIEWINFNRVFRTYFGLFLWYFKYWSYLSEEDFLSRILCFYDYIVAICWLFILIFLNCVYYPIKLLILLIYYSFKYNINICLSYIIGFPYGVGDLFLLLNLVMTYFIYICLGYMKFIYNIVRLGFFDIFGLLYLILIEEIYYTYLVSSAFYIFSWHVHSGVSKLLSFLTFFKLLFKGMSKGAYGVHFQPSLERSVFGRIFRFIRRGPYMWLREERKLTWPSAEHYCRILLIRFLVIFYFFLPNGEEYRRRSVVWQLLNSDLLEDRYVDFSLTPGLRYTSPLYFFVYSNLFAIDVYEYSEIMFNLQHQKLVYFFWCRRKYFNNFKNYLVKIIEKLMSDFYFSSFFLVFFIWWFFLIIYFLVYFIRSVFIILISIFQILVLNIFLLVLYAFRLLFIFQINSILFAYRKSFVLSKFLLHLYDLFAGIFLFVLLFTLVIFPTYYYTIQLMWGMGGIFLTYFYIIWIPLLLLAGIYDEWKLVLHELGEWLFALCFHMGGWSVIFLRIDLIPRSWFLEPEYEINYYGPNAQEYQGFYFVYAGWFMDLFYATFVA